MSPNYDNLQRFSLLFPHLPEITETKKNMNSNTTTRISHSQITKALRGAHRRTRTHLYAHNGHARVMSVAFSLHSNYYTRQLNNSQIPCRNDLHE